MNARVPVAPGTAQAGSGAAPAVAVLDELVGERTAAEALLVDPRLGVLTGVGPDPFPGMPPAWVGYGATVADTTGYGFGADPYGFGASVGDPGRARRAAIGEAVERYCGRVVPPGLTRASWEALRSRGDDATDPESFALYSARQYATPGFPFVPFTRTTEVAWARGRDLRTGEPVLVPASTVYLDHRDSGGALHALSYAGIAAGATRAQAERFALEEVLERDATTIWWASGADADLVADGDRVVALLDDPVEASPEGGRRVRLLRIPSPFGVPVLGAFLEDPAEGLVAFGSAARATATEAATKALVEALGLWQMTRQLADPDSDLWRARAAGRVPEHTFVPFRADRRYADSFRADRRDLVDLPAVAQLYLDPRMHGAPLDRLRPEAPGIRLARIPDVAPVADGPRGPLAVYLERLAAAGLRAVSVDVTTPDVALAGLTVVRVVVPGLYGNAPPAFPYLGGERLYRVPAELGYRTAPLTEDTVTTDPIPLA